jgi:hypothetical protein
MKTFLIVIIVALCLLLAMAGDVIYTQKVVINKLHESNDEAWRIVDSSKIGIADVYEDSVAVVYNMDSIQKQWRNNIK